LVLAQHPSTGKDMGALLKRVFASYPGKGGGNKDFVRAKLAEASTTSAALEFARTLV